ncbi:hypothetical protein [Parafrankia elaeagni]|uniref:hypothetical protein n=1 Tax=Parafrankia elaeagni TaxID=222534 RepID=UPI0003A514DB|nr:hypothetical protein [Parafrankia elaeagni]
MSSARVGRERSIGDAEATTGFQGGDDLDALGLVLTELERLVRRGSELATQAFGQFTAPSGLVELADPEFLDSQGAGLRPWLSDLRAAARAGHDQAVAVGVPAWRRLAADAEEVVQSLVDANDRAVGEATASLAELRQRLTGFQARAGRYGVVEDPALRALHAAASEALTRPPVDLEAAGRLVAEYVAAVNLRAPGTAR